MAGWHHCTRNYDKLTGHLNPVKILNLHWIEVACQLVIIPSVGRGWPVIPMGYPCTTLLSGIPMDKPVSYLDSCHALVLWDDWLWAWVKNSVCCSVNGCMIILALLLMRLIVRSWPSHDMSKAVGMP